MTIHPSRSSAMKPALDIKINDQSVTVRDALVAIADAISVSTEDTSSKARTHVLQANCRPSLLRTVRDGKWPPLGGIARNELVQNPIYDGEAYRVAFKPGEVVVLYCAGNAALRTLSERVGRPAFKYGAHSTPELTKRLESLNRENYAGVIRQGERFIVEPGWNKWEMQQIELVFPLHPLGPIAAARRALRVTLPSAYPFGRFDKDLHRAMAASSLTAFAKSVAGRAYLSAHGVAPDALQRWTAYEFAGPEDIRFSEATECYFTTPFVDMSRLAIITERLILRHLGLR